jgi:hypothetical protein
MRHKGAPKSPDYTVLFIYGETAVASVTGRNAVWRRLKGHKDAALLITMDGILLSQWRSR